MVKSPTPYQLRVLAAVAEHGRHSDAARVIGCTPLAAGSAMKQVRTALGARNSAHAVAIAIRKGLI